MNDTHFRVAPKFYYWLMGLWLYPLAGIVFTSILIYPAIQYSGYSHPREALLFAWITVTLAVAAWAYTRDINRLFYTLTSDALLIGRSPFATVIRFEEIESMVIGLPAHMPWWLRIQRFNPKARGYYHSLTSSRANTILVRLSKKRYLPLCLDYAFLDKGSELMQEFIRRNKSKIVNNNTYTDHEIFGLASARFNTIKSL
jgi:hypothetical protein